MSHHIPSAEETARLLEKKRYPTGKQTQSITPSRRPFTPLPEPRYTPWVAPYDVLYRFELNEALGQSQNPTFVSASVHNGPTGQPTMDVVVRTPPLVEGAEVDSLHLSLDLTKGLQDGIEDVIAATVREVQRATLTSLISRCHG